MAALFQPVRTPVFANAALAPGAVVYFYVAGTSTPKSVYGDPNLTTALGTSVTADANGSLPAIFLDADIELYKYRIEDADGALIDEQDGYGGAAFNVKETYASMVAQRLLYVDSMTDLLTLNTAALQDGQQVSVSDGGTYKWNATLGDFTETEWQQQRSSEIDQISQKADIAPRLKDRQSLSLPTEFSPANYLIDPKLHFRGSRWFSDFDPRSLRPTRANRYFVDPVLGSDAADGLTFDTAFRSVRKALGTAGDNEIICAPGKYYYLEGPQGENPARGVSIICEQGKALFSNEARPRRWVASTQYPGMWATDNAASGEDWTGVSSLRFYMAPSSHSTTAGRLVPYKTMAEIENGSVGVFVDASSTFIRLPNDMDPNVCPEFVVKYAASNLRIICPPASTETIYTENIRCVFGSSTAAYFETTTEGSKCIHVGCEFSEGHANNGGTWLVGGTVINWNCEAHDSLLDGFNYHASPDSSGRISVFEYGCKAHFNGRTTSGTNNGSTVHEHVRIIRVNGDYSNNQNRNIHDINGSKSLNIACTARYGQELGAGSFAFGRDGQADQTLGWLIDCDTDHIVVYPSSTLHLDDNTAYSTLTGAGTTTEYSL